MGGGAPNSPGIGSVLWTVAQLVFLLPLGLVLFQVLVAKIVDALLRRSPFTAAEVSWIGLLFSAAIVVILANVFVDDLYQIKKGHFGVSVVGFILDAIAMVAVVKTGK